MRKSNILHHGQHVAADLDSYRAVGIELHPGEASLHHGWLVHGSNPNVSVQRRIGLTIQYVSPSVRQRITSRESATINRCSKLCYTLDFD